MCGRLNERNWIQALTEEDSCQCMIHLRGHELEWAVASLLPGFTIFTQPTNERHDPYVHSSCDASGDMHVRS